MVPVLCVVGPTASGKSKAAIALAKRFNGEIISADSMQVYSNLTITTAAIPPSEQEGIPHHLLGIADAVTTDFTVLSFRDAARKLIQEVTVLFIVASFLDNSAWKASNSLWRHHVLRRCVYMAIWAG